MAILVDLNQVMISNLMAQLGKHQNAQIDENMVRHMILNSLRSNRMKFKERFGELVICCDDKSNWRKEVFPYYKANRKETRDKSELDWTHIFNMLNRVKDELKENFPYKVIQIEGAEADDIIGVLCHKLGVISPISSTTERYLILSGDKDYKQLLIYTNVEQYDPVGKRYITVDSPERALQELIIRGDAGDGVPNILSQDDCLVMKIRQRPVTQKRLDGWISETLELDDITKNRYQRNKTLIDLSSTPKHIKEAVLKEYDKEPIGNRRGLINYFIKHRLRNLTENLPEF